MKILSEDLKKYDHTYRLLRKKDVEEEYNHHKNGISDILEKFKDPQTKFLFVPNNFPYDLEDDDDYYEEH